MDELLGRKTPHSAPAEQAVIGSMLIDARCIPEVLEKLKPDEFYIQLNRDIYETIYAMFSYSMVIDPVTVLSQMKVRGVYRENCEEYLAEIMRVTPTAANVQEYAAIVRDRALLRRLGIAADDINAMVCQGSGEAEAILDAAERKIYALRQDRNIGGLLPVGSIMQSVFDDLAELAASGNAIPGFSTGLPDLDRMILGLNKAEMIIIAARPGLGKTSIALNIALHAAMNEHKKVAIFSLEMRREELVKRLLSRAALVPSQNLLTAQMTEQQWRGITDAAQALSTTDILIAENGNISVAEMNAQCRRIPNLGLVVIDYLQLMESAGSGHAWSNESRNQTVSDISRMIKIMAKELNVPVVCLSQLNRAVTTRQDKRPMLSDLRESGAIEQDADVVIGIHREGYYNNACENPNMAEAIILKNRKGQTGTVKLQWLPEYSSFSSYENRRDDDWT